MNRKIRLTIALYSVILGLHGLINHTVAQEEAITPPPADKTQPPPTKEVTPSKPASLKNPALEKTVNKYVKAWQKQDFKTMRQLESWEGGEALSEVKYIQNFNADFQIHDWKVTKIESEKKGEYKVLVLVTHNVPKHVAGFVTSGKSVRSTLVQWWKQQQDTFVHLFHIERKRLMDFVPTIEPPTPKK